MTTSTPYGFRTEVEWPYEEAVPRVKEELKKEGFGILCEIDVKETLKEKLGVEFSRYVILGACNPPLAYQTLQQEEEIGLLLPCNVIVYEDAEGKTIVSAIDPEVMLGVVDNPALDPVAGEVKERMRRVIAALA